MSFHTIYNRWRRYATTPDLAKELAEVDGHPSEIADRFYRALEFGTGGLRGVLGAGTNRMNVYTVAKATQGYCAYLLQCFQAPSVAIAYDSRKNSLLFAEKSAAVLAANGISVFIFPQLMPTPVLSYAVRSLRCSGGIVITASHNPSQYNGYKIYGSDGCQITVDAAKTIQKHIEQTDPFDDILSIDFAEGVRQGKIRYITDKLVEDYFSAIDSASILPPEVPKDISIVYTPLNGTGISCVPQCLARRGFTQVIIPKEQREPDGNFPTCQSPNPELREALAVGLRWAEQTGSDLLLATDPDCDRVGVAVKDNGGYTLLNGNQVGVLLLDFICRMNLKNGTMPDNPIAVKTIVTTPMAQKIAANYGVELRNVLTGFKFIGEQISLLERAGEVERFLFGFEESCGYLSYSAVRDKDAVNACVLICEMFAFYKARGISLAQALDQLYCQYGYHLEKLISFQLEGEHGRSQMQAMMDTLRNISAKDLAGYPIVAVNDYRNSKMTTSDGQEAHTTLPSANVLQFHLKGGASAVLRPSGTEPKLKIYLFSSGNTVSECQQVLSKLEIYFSNWVSSFEEQL